MKAKARTVAAITATAARIGQSGARRSRSGIEISPLARRIHQLKVGSNLAGNQKRPLRKSKGARWLGKRAVPGSAPTRGVGSGICARPLPKARYGFVPFLRLFHRRPNHARLLAMDQPRDDAGKLPYFHFVAVQPPARVLQRRGVVGSFEVVPL